MREKNEKLANGRHGQPGKFRGCFGWHGLHVGREDLIVLPEVELKCVTCPATLYFHDIEGDAPE